MDQGALRVSDAEREQVAAGLLRAHGEGRLTLAEYDDRVGAAHAAVVRDDLAPLLADLPAPSATRASSDAPDAARAAGARAVRRRHCSAPGMRPPGMPGGPGLRVSVATWALVSLVNVAIWAAVVLGSAAAVYPWWIWVAGPWGVALAVRAVAERAGASTAAGA